MKTRIFCTATLALSAWSMIAVAQTTAGATQDSAPTAQSMGISSTVSQSDKEFVNAAAQAGLAEVTAGQLAEQKGDKTVQHIGQHMVADHGKLNDELKATAENIGLTLPLAPTAEQQAEYKKLQGVSGAAFDADYLKSQHQAHETAIRLFQDEAANGENPALKKLAVQALPVLREHLKMIEAAQSGSHVSTGA